MSLKPWEDLAPEPLAFPIGGRIFTVKPLSYKDGLNLEHLLSDAEARDGLTDRDLWRLMLGDTFDEMVEAGVAPQPLARAGMAALADHQRGREAAEAIWESGVSPEALAAAATAATRKTKSSKKASTRSTGSGAARKTPSRASTSGTRTSRKR